MVTSATGICEQDIDYFPYGGVILDHCPKVAQHYKFTGKERDAESGLDNFGARYDASSLGRFMSPDPLGGRLVDPQTLNKYSYVRNNPINLTDPTGLYICADSTRDHNCTSDQDKKFEAARQADLARGGDAARAAGAYGNPNKDNGVNVGFADLSKDSERGVTTSTLGADDKGNLRANSNVVIDSTASGDKLEAVVGHEGSHVADAQDLVKSITSDALGNFKVGQDITQYQSEQRAYHVSDSILRSGNQTENYNCGMTECTLGTGLKNPGQVTGEVDRILQNNYKSSINKQPLTPANQGGWVVPH
jgi:RHS repeat-associated protein